MPEPCAPFEDAVVETVAAEHGVDADVLREAIDSQQRIVREFPDMTVEALVHNWRTAFPTDPLVETDATAYYLSVRETVWRDVAGRLDLSDGEREAVRTVNARQFETSVGEAAEDVAVVLTK